MDDAWLQRTGDDAAAQAGGRGSAVVSAGDGAAARAARQVEVCMVEDVVELRTELDLDPLDGGVELLVEVQIGFVEGRRPAVVLGQAAERAGDGAAREQRAAGGIGFREGQSRGVDPLDRPVGELRPLNVGSAGNEVGTVCGESAPVLG